MELYTKKDCIRSMYEPVENDSNVGFIGILDVSGFKEQYRKPEYQLFRIGGGFGSSPSKMGNAVYGWFCYDGEECRMERYNFIGIANEEVTKTAEEYEKAWKKD